MGHSPNDLGHDHGASVQLRCRAGPCIGATHRPQVSPISPQDVSRPPQCTFEDVSSNSGASSPGRPKRPFTRIAYAANRDASGLEAGPVSARPRHRARPVSSAPSRCLGRCQTGELQPSVLQETRKCPWPPTHPHGSQLTVTRPGAQGCPFRHSSGLHHQSGRLGSLLFISQRWNTDTRGGQRARRPRFLFLCVTLCTSRSHSTSL